jgi:hypothetical protein
MSIVYEDENGTVWSKRRRPGSNHVEEQKYMEQKGNEAFDKYQIESLLSTERGVIKHCHELAIMLSTGYNLNKEQKKNLLEFINDKLCHTPDRIKTYENLDILNRNVQDWVKDYLKDYNGGNKYECAG